MGGHGALTTALKTPSAWTSVSAFAPICNPTQCPWGEKAFTAYLGSVEAGKGHDALELLKKSGKSVFDDILIHEGTKDDFKDNQLRLAEFEAQAAKVGQTLSVVRVEGGDHSYHTISTYIDDHIAFHAKRLRQAVGKVQVAEKEDATKAVLSADTAGKPITCKAMVARGPKEPLALEEITVDPPKKGEVRVKVLANALCKFEAGCRGLSQYLSPNIKNYHSISFRPHGYLHVGWL